MPLAQKGNVFRILTNGSEFRAVVFVTAYRYTRSVGVCKVRGVHSSLLLSEIEFHFGDVVLFVQERTHFSRKKSATDLCLCVLVYKGKRWRITFRFISAVQT